MREIISVHIGQAGVQLGSACWELLCLEHGILPNGQISNDKETSPCENLNTFFAETEEGKYNPRALFLDLEPVIIDNIMCGSHRELFDSNLFISGNEDAANCHSRGFYNIGPEVIDLSLEAIRKMAEKCSELQGFLLFHSVGGGTGSGLGSLLLEKLTKEYKELTKINFSIYPAPQNSVSIVEPYNTVLSNRHLFGNSDAVIVLDNEALYEIFQNKLNIKRPTYTNLNNLISHVISSITSSIRFNGNLNASLKEFQTNLVPFQELHFMCPSYAPITSKENTENNSVVDITNAVFEQANSLAKCNQKQGKCLAGTLMYRGDITEEDVISSLENLRNQKTVKIDDWCPAELKWGINAKKEAVFSNDDLREEAKSACMISNSTSITEVFERFSHKFELLFAKRAYVHWFIHEGMEEYEFEESREIMMHIAHNYKEAAIELIDAEEMI